MNILYTVLIIAVIIVVYTIGFITGFQTCRERTIAKLVDMLLEDLGMEGEDDK
jgi:hypothetical protein